MKRGKLAILGFGGHAKVVAEISKGINIDLMDKNISPNEDFFQFINGTWLKDNTIPDDRTRWGSFDELRKMTDDDVLSIVNKAMNDSNIKENSDQAKALNLYKSILDLDNRNAQGVEGISMPIGESFGFSVNLKF